LLFQNNCKLFKIDEVIEKLKNKKYQNMLYWSTTEHHDWITKSWLQPSYGLARLKRR